MKKKLLMALLCGTMVFSLCACGGGDSASSSNSDNNENVGTMNDTDNKDNTKEKVVKKSYESAIYNANGVEQSYSYYEYDEKGREILYKYRVAASGQEDTITTTWNVDGNTAVGTTSSGGTITNEYDADGNLLYSETLQTGQVILKITNTYKNGVLIESCQESTPTSTMKQVTEIKYDEYGNYTYYKVTFNDEAKSLVENKYTYNATGDIETITTKTTAFTLAGEQTFESTSEYIYDNGILKEITSDSGKTEIKCDEDGNILEQISYDANGNIISKTAYTYY